MLILMDKKFFYNFALKNFVYLNLCFFYVIFGPAHEILVKSWAGSYVVNRWVKIFFRIIPELRILRLSLKMLNSADYDSFSYLVYLKIFDHYTWKF